MLYQVTITLLVEADRDTDAYYACSGPVESLVGGDIVDARMGSIEPAEVDKTPI
jgi:hypothetical protein